MQLQSDTTRNMNNQERLTLSIEQKARETAVSWGDCFIDSEEILIIQFFCFQSVPVGKETSFYSGLAGDTGPTEIRENSNEVISYSRLSFTCLIKESLSEGSPPS